MKPRPHLALLFALLAAPAFAAVSPDSAKLPPPATVPPKIPAPAPAATPTASASAAATPPAVSAARLARFADEVKDVTAFLTKLGSESGGPKLVPILPGEFTMGDSNNGPAHKVTISRPFFLGTTEVTQAQWTAVMGNNPSSRKGDTLPVENVSYDDALAFCKKLTERERAAGRLPAGLAFTLPTEAQWEYACRAGTTGDYGGSGTLDEMAWYDKNSGSKTHPVGEKQANAWGLYDMHGNVWEWCADWYGRYPSGAVTDPTGPSSGSVRVYRGGSWGYAAAYARSAHRYSNEPGYRNSFHLGFRLALAPQVSR